MRFIKKQDVAPIALSALLSVLGAFTVVQAATNIGTDIMTTGAIAASSTLQAIGITTAFGALNASSTVLVDGAATFGSTVSIAGATTLTGGAININKTATTTVAFSSAGLNIDSNTLVIDPNANRIGVLTATPNTELEVDGTASTTQLVVGGGTTIKKHLSVSYALTSQAVAGNSCVDNITALTGAATGDTVAIGLPTAFVTAASSTFNVFGYVSSAGNVDIRICQASSTAGFVTAAMVASNARVDVWQH